MLLFNIFSLDHSELRNVRSGDDVANAHQEEMRCGGAESEKGNAAL
jgi:hypothetical protein